MGKWTRDRFFVLMAIALAFAMVILVVIFNGPSN